MSDDRGTVVVKVPKKRIAEGVCPRCFELQAELDVERNRVCHWTLAPGTHQIYNIGCQTEQIFVAQGVLGFCPNCGGKVIVE